VEYCHKRVAEPGWQAEYLEVKSWWRQWWLVVEIADSNSGDKEQPQLAADLARPAAAMGYTSVVEFGHRAEATVAWWAKPAGSPWEAAMRGRSAVVGFANPNVMEFGQAAD